MENSQPSFSHKTSITMKKKYSLPPFIIQNDTTDGPEVIPRPRRSSDLAQTKDRPVLHHALRITNNQQINRRFAQVPTGYEEQGN